jgi:hypothetical protein
MNPEWVVTGIILLGGMTAGGISLYLKRRKDTDSFYDAELQSDQPENEK